jgi:hypothetical protein
VHPLWRLEHLANGHPTPSLAIASSSSFAVTCRLHVRQPSTREHPWCPQGNFWGACSATASALHESASLHTHSPQHTTCFMHLLHAPFTTPLPSPRSPAEAAVRCFAKAVFAQGDAIAIAVAALKSHPPIAMYFIGALFARVAAHSCTERQ